jgi:hypothetical protein
MNMTAADLKEATVPTLAELATQAPGPLAAAAGGVLDDQDASDVIAAFNS